MSLFSADIKPKWLSDEEKAATIATRSGWVYTNPGTGPSDELLVAFPNMSIVGGGPTPSNVAFGQDTVAAGSNKTIEALVYFSEPIDVTAGATMVLTGNKGGVATHGTITPGSGYTDGTYPDVDLTTDGVGTGAKATIVVLAGVVTTVTVTTAGDGYEIGDTLSCLGADITDQGQVATVDTIAGTATGSGTSVAVSTSTDGAGTGLTVTVTRVAPNYTVVTVVDPGVGYAVNDTQTVLGSALGGVDVVNDLTFDVATLVADGSGFETPVATISGNTDTLTYYATDSDESIGLAAFRKTTVLVFSEELFTIGGSGGSVITGTIVDGETGSLGEATALTIVDAGDGYVEELDVPTKNRTGVGAGLLVDITVSGGGLATVSIGSNAGDGYAADDIVMVDQPQGKSGLDGIDFGTFSVDTVDAPSVDLSLTDTVAATLQAGA